MLAPQPQAVRAAACLGLPPCRTRPARSGGGLGGDGRLSRLAQPSGILRRRPTGATVGADRLGHDNARTVVESRRLRLASARLTRPHRGLFDRRTYPFSVALDRGGSPPPSLRCVDSSPATGPFAAAIAGGNASDRWMGALARLAARVAAGASRTVAHVSDGVRSGRAACASLRTRCRSSPSQEGGHPSCC